MRRPGQRRALLGQGLAARMVELAQRHAGGGLQRGQPDPVVLRGHPSHLPTRRPCRGGECEHGVEPAAALAPMAL